MIETSTILIHVSIDLFLENGLYLLISSFCTRLMYLSAVLLGKHNISNQLDATTICLNAAIIGNVVATQNLEFQANYFKTIRNNHRIMIIFQQNRLTTVRNGNCSFSLCFIVIIRILSEGVVYGLEFEMFFILTYDILSCHNHDPTLLHQVTYFHSSSAILLLLSKPG